ncbi:MAG: ABC transporter substrate-binding protein, partial [Bacteroidales bacterium]|nr:ABC transporter substrate-binding protein [Bacteroidales bacterium]
DFRRNPVGTGPFYVKYWEEDVKLVLLKNPHYFEFENEVRLPYLEAINYTFLVDKQSEFLEFIQGDLDYLSGIEPGYKDEILTENGELNPKYAQQIHFSKRPYLNTEYIGILADTNNPLLKDSPLKFLKFRLAIQYAIDKEKMLLYLRNGIGTAGNRGFIPSAFPRKKSRYGYSFDIDKSIELLNQVKFEQHIDVFPSIKVVATAQSMDLLKYIQHQLAQVGLELEIELVQWAALKEIVANSKAVFFRGSWIADYPDPENYLSLFYSGNFAPKGPNYTHFSNQTFDSLYNYSIFATDQSLKDQLNYQMDSLLMSFAYVVPLYYDEVVRFTQKNIKNLELNPMNLLNLKKVQKKISKNEE